ncbi:MAG: hypothetical protein KJ808_09345 [Acidobacteria bacterium]|nr:hypothetical protein [Acidobacteriota bacterium]MBU4404747.1 hypothetical protein [Acidobacteriota bacterium]MCG2810366.1 hypothetical protein [Candidatus Aminicenantes bacterium]
MNLAYVNESYDSLKECEIYLPNNFQRMAINRIETAESIAPLDFIEKPMRSFNNTFLFVIRIDNQNYKTKMPISVNVNFESGMFFAENENLAVCGTGFSQEEAINDLREHIIHFYEYYNKIEIDKLMGEALRLKSVYAKLFV